jgi:N-acetyl-anhydromuramyl-L-alanine amidase AmpD
MHFRSQGTAPKNLIVLHQTISPDYPGTKDIVGVANYLSHTPYGIHVIVDLEGNSAAVSPADERAIYYHAASGSGGVNTRSIGIEQVSYKTSDKNYWWNRARQLHKTARWCAYLSKQHGIPCVYDPTCKAGIVGHHDVTVRYHVPGGHTDCQWTGNGGNYPTKLVALLAANYKRLGWA